MCADRCFSNPNKYETSSDHTRITKQKTIYKDVVNQFQNKTNFIKSNGVNYNQNFGLHNNCLAFAKSYDLLLDVTKGKYYTTPVEDPNWVSNESWSAGLYSVNYSANGVNTVVDTSYNAGNGNHIIFPMTQPAELADISWNGLYPGVRVDPSYNIFYNECDNENYWRKKLVDMSFNNTNYYSQSKQQSEQLYGMYYPANISFDICLCGINIDISTIAVNTGGNNWSVIENKTIEKCQILTIDNGITLNISILIRLTVNGTINNNGTIKTLGSSITNNGTINNNFGASIISSFGGFTNNGKFTNNGEFNNNGGFINNGRFTNNSNFTNPSGAFTNTINGIINNNYGATFFNNGNIDNSGSIINKGTIINSAFNGILNRNIGIFYNNSGGIIDITALGSIFSNNGYLYSPTTNVGCGIGTINGTIIGNPIIDACS